MEWITPIIQVYGYGENNFYIKRDDLLPFSFGGNKVRIAQEFFEDMYSQNKSCIIGYGNTRSNLSRAIANISIQNGIECHIISPSDNSGAHIETNNSIIVHSCGAHIHLCNKNEISERVQNVMDMCRKNGREPYYIYGDRYGQGNEAVPLRAYVKVFKEIQSWAFEENIEFDYIFCAVGTGMTQGGIIAGQIIYGGREKIVGISISRKKAYQEQVLYSMLEAYFDKSRQIDKSKIEVEDNYICGGYGCYSSEVVETIRKSIFMNGVPLDPTYTGKAFNGMLQYIKKRNIVNKNILFIHTGGTPLFFDNIDILDKMKLTAVQR
ncbi:MAG: pyridoxal-phosphate dependent enzyme [Clostridiales bacterium]|nr:pyridoxal-phosphate dependent enzyme [Clostridiales bacterium]